MKRILLARRANGLSLLEVVLAMAILAGAVAVLSQLVGLGVRAAGQTRDLTHAQMLAESLMSEITAGITPPEPFGPSEIEVGWLATVALQPTIHPGIVQVVVLVEENTDSRRAGHFLLARWMRDPTLELPTEPVEEESGESSPSSQGSAGSASDTSGDDGSNPPPSSGGGASDGSQQDRGGRGDGRGDAGGDRGARGGGRGDAGGGRGARGGGRGDAGGDRGARGGARGGPDAGPGGGRGGFSGGGRGGGAAGPGGGRGGFGGGPPAGGGSRR